MRWPAPGGVRVVNWYTLPARLPMHRFHPFFALVVCLFGAVPVLAAPSDAPAPDAPMPNAEVRTAFVSEMSQKYPLTTGDIAHWLDEARFQPSIVAAMSRPAEGVKAWKDYRPIFLGERRIREGQAFLAEHRDELAKVEAQTGVPAEIVTAIIGVETSYGKITGNYRVLDALYTLGFFYPASGLPEKRDYEARRGQFFRNELAQLLVLAQENRFDLTTLKGSYAGAMGWGQFMPSSYRAYARDGDGDGRIDLFGNLPDIFASVANYFAAHGWQKGEPVVARALADAQAKPLVPGPLQASYSIAELGNLGYRPEQAQGHDLKANLVVLEGGEGTEYWLGFPNFYVITRYNVSSMYAMAVHQLSREIAVDPALAQAP